MDALITGFFGLLAFIVIYRFIRYITTPLLKKIGFYNYYSKAFFTVPIWKNRLEMHMGTSWDLFRLERLDAKTQMFYLAKGLAKLCAEIEQGKFSKDAVIYGTTYYFSNATLQRFGFRVREQSLLEKFMFGLNYLELCLLFSISRRKLSFVNTDLVKVAYCPLERLVQNKADYERLALRMSGQSPDRLIDSNQSDALAA